MSEVNPFVNVYSDVEFLPDWHVAAQRRRRFRKIQYVAAGVIIAGMVYGWGSVRHHIQGLETYREALNHQVATAESSVAKVAELQATRDDLSQQVDLHRALQQSIHYSQVSGTLAHFTPEQIALTRLEVSTRHVPRPIDRTQVAQATEGPQAKPKVDSFVEVTLEGIAPSDVFIANYVGALATSGLFDEVTMVHSIQHDDGKATERQFEITMSVPLNRQYRPRLTEEVVDAR